MTEGSWLITVLGAVLTALFGAVTFVLQASIRGTWIPKSTYLLLAAGNEQLVKLKDEQIGLLAAERDGWKAVAEKQTAQITLFAEASQTTKHFFQEVPVVPSKGDNQETSAP